MKNTLFHSAFFAAGLALASGAEQSPPAADSAGTFERKVDRMSGKVDDIHEDTRVIRRELVESPLGNRSWGVEINPARLLFISEGLDISGTVSNFSLNRSAELSVPFVYTDGNGDSPYTILTVGAHYRHFLGGRQRGFYLGGLARYQYAEYLSQPLFAEPREKMLSRAGIAFEIGYRIFSRSGIYWGCSLAAGRYMVGGEVGESEWPNVGALWFKDLILDVELLKLGFAF
jgi:hypothetical protein